MSNQVIGEGAKIAQIPQTAVTDPQLRPVVDAVRNIFNTRAFGKNPLDRWVTWRDLVDSNMVVYKQGNTTYIGSGNGSGFLPLPGGEDDFTPPPAPTGFSIDGAFNNIIIEWNDPTSAYGNHSYTEIWRSGTNDLGTAALIGQAPGAVFADPVGTNTVFYYWIRFVSRANVVGPYNSLLGTSGQTALDPSYMLQVLTGAITETQLFSSLNSRLNLIEVNQTAITNEATVRASADSSLASQISTVSATTNSNTAAIQNEVTARTNADSALSTQISTVQATVNSNTIAIQTETNARVNADNSLFAQYSVKIDTNGYVSGFGLSSTANNATPFSDFIIRADRFSIASPSGPGITPIVPFVVNTTAQTINGVSVPAGVYMDAAFIKNGTITNAKIGNAAIDSVKIADAAIVNAKIGDAAITSAKIQDATIIGAKIALATITGANIASATIGTAQIADAAITNAKISALDAGKINTGTLDAGRIAASTITADKIDSRNLTIKDGSGNIIFGAGTNLDWGRISNQPGGIYNSNISIGSNGVLYGAGGGAVSLSGLGAGNFAFISQLNSANITSYIAGAAIGTALIQNAAITNALIANGAISQAKIGDAEISTAKIGVAQIDTLRIAGNAVTTQVIFERTDFSSNVNTKSLVVPSGLGGPVIINLYCKHFSQPDMFINGNLVLVAYGLIDYFGYDEYVVYPYFYNAPAGSFTITIYDDGVSSGNRSKGWIVHTLLTQR